MVNKQKVLTLMTNHPHMKDHSDASNSLGTRLIQNPIQVLTKRAGNLNLKLILKFERKKCHSLEYLKNK